MRADQSHDRPESAADRPPVSRPPAHAEVAKSDATCGSAVEARDRIAEIAPGWVIEVEQAGHLDGKALLREMGQAMEGQALRPQRRSLARSRVRESGPRPAINRSGRRPLRQRLFLGRALRRALHRRDDLFGRLLGLADRGGDRRGADGATFALAAGAALDATRLRATMVSACELGCRSGLGAATALAAGRLSRVGTFGRRAPPAGRVCAWLATAASRRLGRAFPAASASISRTAWSQCSPCWPWSLPLFSHSA